jgi:hypothetical protein
MYARHALIDGKYMKKPQQYRIIVAFIFPALFALSPAVFAEDTAARYAKQIEVDNSDPGHWSIPPISKRWNAPPRRGVWTIPPISRQWGIPKRSPHWTIPRTANDLLTVTK